MESQQFPPSPSVALTLPSGVRVHIGASRLALYLGLLAAHSPRKLSPAHKSIRRWIRLQARSERDALAQRGHLAVDGRLGKRQANELQLPPARIACRRAGK